AVGEWRALVAVAGDRYAANLRMGACSKNLCGHWRDELAQLEANLQELEQQRGSADGAALDPPWTPRVAGDVTPPQLEHDRILHAPVGQALRVVARASDPSGVRSLRLRYRHVTQYEDYATLELQPTGRSDEFAATIP